MFRRLEETENTLRDAIQDIVDQIPIHKRVNVESIREMINNQLQLRGLSPDFEFAVIGDGLVLMLYPRVLFIPINHKTWFLCLCF